MIVITGGAGFIGSNLLEELNKIRVNTPIFLFDNIGKKRDNLKNLVYKSLYDKSELFDFLKIYQDKIKIIFHLGACTNTLENNWDYLIKNNYIYTKKLAIFCARKNIKLIYASSASVYGKSSGFQDETKNINNFIPLNLYAKSKLKFDKFLLQNFKSNAKIIGLRYFNVYGGKEELKKKMSSPVHNFTKQIIKNKYCKIFGAFDNYDAGNHSRDFVYVKDCVKLNILFVNKKINKLNIFNVGSGTSTSFNVVAEEIISNLGYGKIKYIKFPDKLKIGYQSSTHADLSRLNSCINGFKFLNIKNGIKNYLKIDKIIK